MFIDYMDYLYFKTHLSHRMISKAKTDFKILI